MICFDRYIFGFFFACSFIGWVKQNKVLYLSYRFEDLYIIFFWGKVNIGFSTSVWTLKFVILCTWTPFSLKFYVRKEKVSSSITRWPSYYNLINWVYDVVLPFIALAVEVDVFPTVVFLVIFNWSLLGLGVQIMLKTKTVI